MNAFDSDFIQFLVFFCLIWTYRVVAFFLSFEGPDVKSVLEKKPLVFFTEGIYDPLIQAYDVPYLWSYDLWKIHPEHGTISDIQL